MIADCLVQSSKSTSSSTSTNQSLTNAIVLPESQSKPGFVTIEKKKFKFFHNLIKFLFASWLAMLLFQWVQRRRCAVLWVSWAAPSSACACSTQRTRRTTPPPSRRTTATRPSNAAWCSCANRWTVWRSRAKQRDTCARNCSPTRSNWRRGSPSCYDGCLTSIAARRVCWRAAVCRAGTITPRASRWATNSSIDGSMRRPTL